MRIRCPLTFDALAMALLLACAVVIGTYRTADTGAQWPDGPCYANAAAMIHDWLRSGDLLHPYEFAKQNYRQYPAFAVPFHPPGYPGVLALFFALLACPIRPRDCLSRCAPRCLCAVSTE